MVGWLGGCYNTGHKKKHKAISVRILQLVIGGGVRAV